MLLGRSADQSALLRTLRIRRDSSRIFSEWSSMSEYLLIRPFDTVDRSAAGGLVADAWRTLPFGSNQPSGLLTIVQAHIQ